MALDFIIPINKQNDYISQVCLNFIGLICHTRELTQLFRQRAINQSIGFPEPLGKKNIFKCNSLLY